VTIDTVLEAGQMRFRVKYSLRRALVGALVAGVLLGAWDLLIFHDFWWAVGLAFVFALAMLVMDVIVRKR